MGVGQTHQNFRDVCYFLAMSNDAALTELENHFAFGSTEMSPLTGRPLADSAIGAASL
jgi:hypothetical protein